jgi:putative CocE/NonD family hydrolase
VNTLLLFIFLSSTFGFAGPASVDSPFPAITTPQSVAIAKSSFYLPMRDGTRLAIEVVRPSSAPDTTRMPAIVRFTRYGRTAGKVEQVLATDAFWIARNYIVVVVDQRGTGASFGQVRYGKPEFDDMRTVLDWVVAQAWSNGRTGAIGSSYEGTTAELLAATGHSSVRAVAPLYSDYTYFDLFRPGGIFNEGLASGFSEVTSGMDAGDVATPVTSDTDKSLMRAALSEHRANPDLAKALRSAEFADDAPIGFGIPETAMAPIGVQAELAHARVPELQITSWYDAAIAQGVLTRYATLPIPQRVVINATSHGGTAVANPFRAPVPNTDGAFGGQARLAAAFFAPYLTGDTPPMPAANRITYFTCGENVWHETAIWPPAGFTRRHWHLGRNAHLALAPDTGDSSLPLTAVTTGPHNRWYSQLTGEEVSLADIAHGAAGAPSFTTDPLQTSIEITGTPMLRLTMNASIADPSLFAYLLAIAPDGTAVDLTQGELRLIQRKLNTSAPTLHSFLRADVQRITPGAQLDVPIALLPLSVTVPKGYRLRIALAAGELPAFATAGPYTASVRGTSQLDVPMRERPDLDGAR